MDYLEFDERRWRLERFPLQENRASLQAWDAADEYLLAELAQRQQDPTPLILVNDSFGTLACALSDYSPISISDSQLSQLATRHNLQLNEIPAKQVKLQDSLTPWPQGPATVLLRIPRTLALLEQQLHMLRQVATADTVIIAAAKTRDVHTSTLRCFENIIGPTTTSLAKKKARLIYSRLDPALTPLPLQLCSWSLNDYQIHNHANVFARTGLDIGARFFLDYLPENLTGKLADLGCGNGVLGLTLLGNSPQAEVYFIDESYMAVASSKINVEVNRHADLPRSHFKVNNSLDGFGTGYFQAIFCNPPFHQNSVLTDQIAWNMFLDARRCLVTGGELWIVGNRHLGYHQKLKRLFGNCTLVASNRKFVILRASK